MILHPRACAVNSGAVRGSGVWQRLIAFPVCDRDANAGPQRVLRETGLTYNFADLLVVFDLDGTLVDTAPDLLTALNQVLVEESLPPVAAGDVRHLMGHGAAALLAYGHMAAGHEWNYHSQAHCVERLIAIYRDGIALHSRLFPGAEAMLDELARRKVRLAICTNKPTYLARKLLDELGLSARFSAIVGSELGQPRKPDPKHLCMTIEAAGHLGARVVMVGDSTNDIDAARGCGVPSIAVRFGYLDRPVEELGADVIIDNFDQLASAITDLFGKTTDLDVKVQWG